MHKLYSSRNYTKEKYLHQPVTVGSPQTSLSQYFPDSGWVCCCQRQRQECTHLHCKWTYMCIRIQSYNNWNIHSIRVKVRAMRKTCYFALSVWCLNACTYVNTPLLLLTTDSVIFTLEVGCLFHPQNRVLTAQPKLTWHHTRDLIWHKNNCDVTWQYHRVGRLYK